MFGVFSMQHSAETEKILGNSSAKSGKRLLLEIWQTFDQAFTEYCTTLGVRTVPFWRLSIADRFEHNPDVLRKALLQTLVCEQPYENFCEKCIPAFLLWMQTQATGHSHFLWEDTVIPLLAGSDDDGDLFRKKLRVQFGGNGQLHIALRRWLGQYKRTEDYVQGDNYHFWFVRAVIGECALLWVRNDFVDRFFDGSLTDWARESDSRAMSNDRFTALYDSYTRNHKISKDALGSIAALRECLVEAGTRLSSLARIACGQVPPAGGWTVNSLLERASKLTGITLSDLPRRVVDVLRERLEQGMVSLSLDQLVAFFRLYPEAVFRCSGGSWTLRDALPPPVARGTLCLGDESSQPVILVDDFGRGPDDLLNSRIRDDNSWHEQDGGRWRVSSTPFETDHPNRLRQAARPIVGNLGTLTKPDAWVWTGLAAHAVRLETHRKSIEEICRKGGLQVFAWPSLDSDSLPCLYLSRFRYLLNTATRIDLVSECDCTMSEVIWSGLPSSDWVILRRSIPAVAGNLTHISVHESGEPATSLEHLKFRWQCPAVFASGRRLRPGQHVIPIQGNIVLVTTGTPEVRGGRLRTIASGKLQLGDATSYEVIPEDRKILSIAADGERWRIEPRETLTIRLRLVQESPTGPDGAVYCINEPGIKAFFSIAPRLTIEVSAVIFGRKIDADELWELIDNVQLAIGGASDIEPAISVTCGSLRDVCSVNLEEQGFVIALSLAAFAPVNMLLPGLDLRRVAICGWLEAEHPDSVVNSGQAERFMILPYAVEHIHPCMPGQMGAITLEDPSNVFRPLELVASSSNEIPATGQNMIARLPLSAKLPLSQFTLETWRTVPLLGAWFWKPAWTISDLADYAKSTESCVRIVPPPNCSELRITVIAGESKIAQTLVGEEKLLLDGKSDFPLKLLLPECLRRDVNSQRAWLANSFSTIFLEANGNELGSVVIDLRPCVTALKPLVQHESSAAGNTALDFEVEVIPGFLTETVFEIIATKMNGTSAPVSIPIQVSNETPGLARQVLKCTIVLAEPGEYRLDSKRRADDAVLASMKVIAHYPQPSAAKIPLAEFLEAWPDGQPTLANIICLYKFLPTVPEPWAEFSLCTAVARSRDAIEDRESTCYSLIDSLHGFLEEPPLNATKVCLIEPENIPQEILAEVGTVAMHLEYYADEALREGLPVWKTAFLRASQDRIRSVEEINWLRVLAQSTQSLSGESRITQPASQDRKPLHSKTYFPCRADFLKFLSFESVLKTDM